MKCGVSVARPNVPPLCPCVAGAGAVSVLEACAAVSTAPAQVASPQPDLPVGCLGEELRSDRKKVSCAAHELREYYLIVGLMENIM